MFFVTHNWDNGVQKNFESVLRYFAIEKMNRLVVAKEVTHGDFVIPTDVSRHFEVISFDKLDIEHFGLFDNFENPLWKDGDFTLYYLASLIDAEYYIYTENDVLFSSNEAEKFIQSEIESGIDGIFTRRIVMDTDYSDGITKYATNPKLGYNFPTKQSSVSKNVAVLSNQLIQDLLKVRRQQSELAKADQNLLIPFDERFLGFEVGLQINKSYRIKYLVDEVAYAFYPWKPEYFGYPKVQKFIGVQHPVSNATTVLKKIVERSYRDIMITPDDIFNPLSDFQTRLLPAVKIENPSFKLSQEMLDTRRFRSREEQLALKDIWKRFDLLPELDSSNIYNEIVKRFETNNPEKFISDIAYLLRDFTFENQLDSNNLALFAKVTMSSQYKSFTGGDKLTNGNFNLDNMAHTNSENHAWMSIDLGKVFTISNIKMYHRDGLFWRTRNIDILASVDGENFTSIHSVHDLQWESLRKSTDKNVEKYLFEYDVKLDKDISVRYLKFVNMHQDKTPLHLNQVAIYR